MHSKVTGRKNLSRMDCRPAPENRPTGRFFPAARLRSGYGTAPILKHQFHNPGEVPRVPGDEDMSVLQSGGSNDEVGIVPRLPRLPCIHPKICRPIKNSVGDGLDNPECTAGQRQDYLFPMFSKVVLITDSIKQCIIIKPGLCAW